MTKRQLTEQEIEDLVSFIEPNEYLPDKTALSIMNKNKNRLRKQLNKITIYPACIPALSKEIQKQYFYSQIDAGETVGIIAPQSIGERLTQQTLNSVEWNTVCLFEAKQKMFKIRIGKWIDSLLENNPNKIIHIKNNRTQYLELDEYIRVPTVSEDGVTSWGVISAVTRHLPVGSLVKVKTSSGREVIATRSKSFLVWCSKQKKLIGVNGSNIQIDDQLPVTFCFNGLNDIKSQERNNNIVGDIILDKIVSIKDYISEHEYVYDLTVPSTLNFCIYNGLGVRDTFHHCGIAESSVLTGVPRFTELLMATKRPKGVSCRVPFLSNNSSIQELRTHIAKHGNITEVKLKDLVISEEICEDKEEELWYESFKVLYNTDLSKYDSCISFQIDMNKLFEYSINLKHVAKVLEREYGDILCVFSPSIFGQLDVFVETSAIELSEQQLLFVTEENKYRIYLEEVVLDKLLNILITGLDKIDNIFYTEKDGKWMIDTNSSVVNLEQRTGNVKLSANRFFELLAFPEADMKRVLSNNMWDVYTIFGIEATREFLISEFMSIMSGINICHVKLLVERMTYSGSITSISRYAMRKDGAGALAKASFEECLDNLLNAAVAGEIESTDGVSASIICGKLAKIGNWSV